MITLANIRKAIYCLNKRIDLLEQNGISGGSSGEGASSSEVAEIRGKVEALESIISEGDNPTAAIDKFNEIVAFLESIQNTDTLSGILADIAALIPTNISELLNDAGYLTQHLDISGKSDKLPMNGENAAVEDNIMSISSNGNPKDSGISVNNIALKTGYYKNLHAGLADNLFGETQTNDVFTFRPTAGMQDIQSGDAPVGGGTIKKVEGNGVSWNQLHSNPQFSITEASTVYNLDTVNLITGHTYLFKVWCSRNPTQGGNHDFQIYCTGVSENYHLESGGGRLVLADNTGVMYFYARTYSDFGTSVSCALNVIDLTLLGIDNLTTVADVETWLANNVGLKDYYPYNEGELISVKDYTVKSVGFNQWDEEWEVGAIKSSDGDTTSYDAIRSKNFIPVLPNTQYYFKIPYSVEARAAFYDANKKYLGIGTGWLGITGGGLRTTPAGARYMKFYVAIATYNHDICINLSYDGDRDGDYEEHWEREVGIDVTTLKGKLNGAGSSVVVFHDGLKKVGTVYDEIVKVGNVTKAIKNICQVLITKDFNTSGGSTGTTGWGGTNTIAYYWYFNDISQYASAYGSTTSNIVICNLLRVGSAYGSDIECVGVTTGNSPYLVVRINRSRLTNYGYDNSSAQSNIAAFKAWLEDNPLIVQYPITPEEYILDEDILPVQYRVDNYGTEEVLLGNDESIVSSSPKMTISYGINAADTIADLQNNYVSTNPLNLTSSLKLLIKLNLELSYNDLKDKPTIPQIWRGTLVLYDALVANNQIDNNTIYVIIESLS